MPDRAFTFFFIDEDFDRQYQFEAKLGSLLSSLSALATFIAGIGLLGLASDAAQRRRREVSIRKVLGASVAQVWSLLIGRSVSVNWGITASALMLSMVIPIFGYSAVRISKQEKDSEEEP